jgi:hypothetical protein
MDAARGLFDDFAEFIKSSPEPQQSTDLVDFILEWLENGQAVVESGGDFGTYMTGVVHIITKWLDDPPILHYRPSTGGDAGSDRIATGVCNITGSPLALDRDYFQTILFRRLTAR